MPVVAVAAADEAEAVAAPEGRFAHEVPGDGVVDRLRRVGSLAAPVHGHDLGDGLEDGIRRDQPSSSATGPPAEWCAKVRTGCPASARHSWTGDS